MGSLSPWGRELLPTRLGEVWRRIPTTGNPQVARLHVLRVIEAQGRNGGAADGGDTDDMRVVSAESEVFLPDVSARVEQGDFHTRFGVNSSDAGGFMKVTEATSIIPSMITAVDPRLLIR
jgi:hypothetical protein